MKTMLRVSLLCVLSAASAAAVTAERMAPIPLDKMSHGKHADLQLQATDVLYVPMSKVKSVILNSQGIVAAAASATIYATAVN